MVTVFLEEVLCWKSTLPGLYGHTNAFYGTVEQQGRLTLHLHMLIWVMNAFSPQEIRDRIMKPDSVFQRKIIDYLESAHQGEFINGSMQDVKQSVRFDSRPTPEELDLQRTASYTPPILTMPSVPPPLCISKHADIPCQQCKELESWWRKYEDDIDDVWLRTNTHTCKQSRGDAIEAARQKDWRKLSPDKHQRTKVYWERRGCLSKKGVCKARFPRDVFESTTVDSTGHINIKHQEPYLNTMSRVVTHYSRCNTDVTSLLSGTAVKAVVSYVSDYVSKIGLKSYQAFASVYDVFER
ncbi:hypothetical protein K438DRAFT_1607297, partial [Mycena galopus ATCC 62051]